MKGTSKTRVTDADHEDRSRSNEPSRAASRVPSETNEPPTSPRPPERKMLLVTYAARSDSPEMLSEDEIELAKKILRKAIFFLCINNILKIIIAAIIYVLVHTSKLPERLKLLLLLGLIIGMLVKALFVIFLFIGALKENPTLIYCGGLISWLMFLTQGILGIMGFVFFLRLSFLTINFLVATYFASIMCCEAVNFCRSGLIINTYRDLLLNRQIDDNILISSLCCSSCSIPEFVRTSRLRQRT